MLQLLQHLGNGSTSLMNVPAPGAMPRHLLVRTSRSLISSGTERMLVDFGKAGWLGKARRQPEKVRAVLDKVRSEGVLATWQAVRSKLNQPIPLGYCNVGVVVGIADERSSLSVIGSQERTDNQKQLTDNSHAFSVGDRVVSNSPHAEVVSAPQLLCATVPGSVDDETATFTPLAAIALEGIDLLAVSAGDRIVVTGLGLIGQLAVRLLRARGCDVLGFDPAAERRSLAAESGAELPKVGEDPVVAALRWSRGQGVAGVLITASTAANELVNQAARSCRFRGKVVLVGIAGLHLNRADFYRNEISFQVSCSYGRRDSGGPGSVRDNFTRVLEFMARGELTVRDLISHRFRFSNAPEAYAALSDRRSLGILLEYDGRTTEDGRQMAQDGGRTPDAEARLGKDAGAMFARTVVLCGDVRKTAAPSVALVGAGNFAFRTLLPTLVGLKSPPHIAAIVSNQGAAAFLAAERFGAAKAATDESTVFADASIQAVFITTRHDSHAGQAIAALKAAKHVWVEKPLALTVNDVDAVAAAAGAASRQLMVGFNRRYAPMAVALRDALRERGEPFAIEMTVNAGRLDGGHWTLDRHIGGGRIVGEGCHFVDLARFLTQAPIASARCLRRDSDGQDGGRFELLFAGGSSAMIDYRTDLPTNRPKETINISGRGFHAGIMNWRELQVRGLEAVARQKVRWGGPRKGHAEAIRAFFAAVKSADAIQPLDELVEVSRWALALQEMGAGEQTDVSRVMGQCPGPVPAERDIGKGRAADPAGTSKGGAPSSLPTLP